MESDEHPPGGWQAEATRWMKRASYFQGRLMAYGEIATAEQADGHAGQAEGRQYLSNACIHSEHDKCNQECEFCHDACRCPCHPRWPEDDMDEAPDDNAYEDLMVGRIAEGSEGHDA